MPALLPLTLAQGLVRLFMREYARAQQPPDARRMAILPAAPANPDASAGSASSPSSVPEAKKRSRQPSDDDEDDDEKSQEEEDDDGDDPPVSRQNTLLANHPLWRPKCRLGRGGYDVMSGRGPTPFDGLFDCAA